MAPTTALAGETRRDLEYPENDQTYLRETIPCGRRSGARERKPRRPPIPTSGWAGLLGVFALHATYSQETTTNPVDNADGVRTLGVAIKSLADTRTTWRSSVTSSCS